MNLESYLENKEKQKAFQDKESQLLRYKCLKCLRPKNICFCASITPFQTKTKIVILMHPKEARRNAIGTGRLGHISLLNSQIITGINFDLNKEVQSLLQSPNYFPVLLYPGDNSHKVNEENFQNILPDNKELLVFVMDGTWPCAKTMMRESQTLHNLPKVSFEIQTTSQFKIKHQPDKFCLSTIESLYHLLDGLNQSGLEKLNDAHKSLLGHLDRIVNFQIECASNPNLGGYRRGRFKNPEDREINSKWQKRKIYFEKKNYT